MWLASLKCSISLVGLCQRQRSFKVPPTVLPVEEPAAGRVAADAVQMVNMGPAGD